MLQVKPQGKIVERIVRTKTGEFVLATFYVVERNGEIINVRLLSVKPVSDQAKNYKLETTNSCLCLRGSCLKSPSVIPHRKRYTPTVSPFFNIFEFLVSQPTRAPSL